MLQSVGFALVVLGIWVPSVAMGTKYTVGGSAGWGVNTAVVYQDWANTNLYFVDDTLFFPYAQGTHSVVQLTQEDYGTCNTAFPLEDDNSIGNVEIQLGAPGNYYFSCGLPGHCGKGLRFMINVQPYPSTVAPVGFFSPPVAPTNLNPNPNTFNNNNNNNNNNPLNPNYNYNNSSSEALHISLLLVGNALAFAFLIKKLF